MRRITLTVVLVAMVAGACSDGEVARDSSGRLTESGEVSVFELRVGDCLDPSPDVESELTRVTAMPCDKPHAQEVFALVPFTDGDTFPGAEEMEEFAEARCLDRFADYVGTDYVDSELFFTFLAPSQRSWDQENDRDVVCVVTTEGTSLTESVAGSGR